MLGAVLGAGILVGCADDPNEGNSVEGAGEHGSGAEGSGAEGGGESGGEGGAEGAGGEGHSAGGEGGSESAGGEAGVELNEAAMSSPVVPLDQAWDGTLGPLSVSAWYDQATQTAHTTVQNISSQTQCYVQAEPHLKSGTTTVGELGPDKLGDLTPGEQATSSVALATEPALANVAFDGYVVHMEVFDCAGPGPQPHNTEAGEGGGGEGAGGEGHGAGGEGGTEGGGSEGAESGGGGEEGSGANALALDETFDQTRNGARLVMAYDPAANTFNGTVTNTTNNTLTRARVEVHLTNGVELGPTTPVNLAPGQSVAITLDATGGPFTGWTPHAEVGSGEGGGSSGEGSGGEGAGEHGSSGESGGEGGGEHGSGGESGSG